MTFCLGFRTSLAVLAVKLFWFVQNTFWARNKCYFRHPQTGEEIVLPRKVPITQTCIPF